jgi:Phage tail sheath protein subtilisin-like domain/TIR domain
VSGIVISYRREDAEGSAGRLYDRLVGRYGADFVFMDYYSIESGEDWMKVIEEAVAGSTVLLAVIGPRWSSITDQAGARRLDDERDYVRHEIRTALQRSARVLPVFVERAPMLSAETLPADMTALADIQNLVLDSRYYDRDVERVFRFIDEIVAFGGELPRFDQQRTAVAGFVGLAKWGPVDEPILVTNWDQFHHNFGGYEPGLLLAHSVYGWFANGGDECFVVRMSGEDEMSRMGDVIGGKRTGLATLEENPAVTIVAAPDIVGMYERGEGVDARRQVESLQLELIVHCEHMGNRLAILDPLPELAPRDVYDWAETAGWDSQAAALYDPWVTVYDPGDGHLISIPPSGHVAGTWARVDKEKGVWTAPANVPLRGVAALQQQVTERELFELDRARINVIRALPDQGIRVWGARTLSSLYPDIARARSVSSLGKFVRDATAWAAFERSSTRVWTRLRSSVEIALDTLWRKGAFVGETAADAFYVRCDGDVNPPEFADAGRVRVEFGFALKVPGESCECTWSNPPEMSSSSTAETSRCTARRDTACPRRARAGTPPMMTRSTAKTPSTSPGCA